MMRPRWISGASCDVLPTRSNLRVSLSTVQKYLDADGSVFFLPQHAVSAEQVRETPADVARRLPTGDLRAGLDAYETLGPGPRNRRTGEQISQDRPAWWSTSLHYQFIRRREGIGVEPPPRIESRPGFGGVDESVRKRG